MASVINPAVTFCQDRGYLPRLQNVIALDRYQFTVLGEHVQVCVGD